MSLIYINLKSYSILMISQYYLSI